VRVVLMNSGVQRPETQGLTVAISEHTPLRQDFNAQTILPVLRAQYDVLMSAYYRAYYRCF
jgi:hypothetical protein